MTTTTIKPFRPLLAVDNIEWYRRINWKWVLQRIPMVLFAIVSSYGVGHFLEISGLPFLFAVLGGISFDIGFLGVIAIADQHLKKTRSSQITYYAINITMSFLAALFNVLSHSGGTYAAITAEDITAGAPFAIVGLVFALFYHAIMSQKIDEEIALQTETDKVEKEKVQYEKDHPYSCVCTARFKTRSGLGKHKKTCIHVVSE